MCLAGVMLDFMVIIKENKIYCNILRDFNLGLGLGKWVYIS